MAGVTVGKSQEAGSMLNCDMSLGFAYILLMTSVATAQHESPQFRGPSGDGVVVAADPPIQWSESKNIRWKVSIPGRGRSSPVLCRNRIWLSTAEERGVRRTRIDSDDMQVADYVSLEAVCQIGRASCRERV
jgi:hypothetical protein